MLSQKLDPNVGRLGCATDTDDTELLNVVRLSVAPQRTGAGAGSQGFRVVTLVSSHAQVQPTAAVSQHDEGKTPVCDFATGAASRWSITRMVSAGLADMKPRMPEGAPDQAVMARLTRAWARQARAENGREVLSRPPGMNRIA